MNEVSSALPPRGSVVQDFARSELFERTFREGMELVETAAVYLDGPGRQESKLLSRNAALAYASESMRLTTRLMQVASWLLVQRAVREGDMSAQEASDPRYRIGPQPAARLVAELDVPAAGNVDRDDGQRARGRAGGVDGRRIIAAASLHCNHGVERGR